LFLSLALGLTLLIPRLPLLILFPAATALVLRRLRLRLILIITLPVATALCAC